MRCGRWVTLTGGARSLRKWEGDERYNRNRGLLWLVPFQQVTAKVAEHNGRRYKTSYFRASRDQADTILVSASSYQSFFGLVLRTLLLLRNPEWLPQ